MYKSYSLSYLFELPRLGSRCQQIPYLKKNCSSFSLANSPNLPSNEKRLGLIKENMKLYFNRYQYKDSTGGGGVKASRRQ